MYHILFHVSENKTLSFRIAPTLPTEDDKPTNGVLQVYDGISKWGNVCVSGYTWTFHEADLACKYMGFTSARLARVIHLNSGSSNSTPAPFINRINCGGISTFQSCVFMTWDNRYRECLPSRIAGLECIGK